MPLHGLLMFLGSFLLARRLHRQYHFDCIDAHYVYPDGFAAVLLGKLLRLPVVISARGTDINIFPSFSTIRPMLLWTLRNARGIVAVSAALKKAVVDLGLPADAVCVIPNGVDLERFHPTAQPEARCLLGLPKEAKIVVSVGSLTEGKNHSLLIAAFARVSISQSEARLYILGEGPRRPALEALICTLHLTDKVMLIGAKPNAELAMWFCVADISCLASSREGWPNVVMESIACGTPIVATRVGGLPEIIISPDLGLLVEQDQKALSDALEFALEKDWDRMALVRHARARSWDRVAAEVDQFLGSRAVRATR
jgi:glycosyltransferase involved in cell wall biosynthesis